MNKWKVILDYVLKFLVAIILIFLTLIIIFKFTVFNKNYIKNVIKNDNYYEKVNDSIKENMENYIISSGFSENILDNIYTKEDVKKSIDNFIDNIYSNKKNKVDMHKIENKINSNIDEYIKDQEIQILDKESISSLVDDLLKIYTNETELYNMFDNYINLFSKVQTILNILLISLLVVTIILIIILIKLKLQDLGIIPFTSGLMLLYLRFLIYNNIDYKNILIITDNFSGILVQIIAKIVDLILICGIILGVMGLIAIILDSRKKNKIKE